MKVHYTGSGWILWCGSDSWPAELSGLDTVVCCVLEEPHLCIEEGQARLFDWEGVIAFKVVEKTEAIWVNKATGNIATNPEENPNPEIWEKFVKADR